jgi:hypothetical protein
MVRRGEVGDGDMSERGGKERERVAGGAADEGSVPDVHPSEPAEGAREPGADPAGEEREHPSEPAEGRPDGP